LKRSIGRFHGLAQREPTYRRSVLARRLLAISRIPGASTVSKQPQLAILFGIICLIETFFAVPARTADSATCWQLQAKYPQFKGKALVDAVNSHTPDYEALDPQDPSRYVGSDIDFVQAFGDCLGFSVT
jgi:hypothetical protein